MSDHTKLYLVCENKCLVEYSDEPIKQYVDTNLTEMGQYVDTKLAKVGYQVGDVLTTARTDLGEDWLLCNGEAIRESDYPELYIVAKEFGLLDSQKLWKSTNVSYINCITYANGYWVAGGRYCDGSNYYARIAYTTDLAGEWTTKDINDWTAGSAYYSYFNLNCITYANGYWVVGGQYYDGSNSYARIAYTTDLAGEWTTKVIWKSYTSSGNLNCITYANGYWVVGGRCFTTSSSPYARIAYTTDLAGEWTTKDIWAGDTGGTYSRASYINCITYANGYWVAGGRYCYGSNYYARIAYTTDLAGEWTTKDIWAGDTGGTYSSNNYINCITYANGYWVVGGQYYDGSNSYARIAYTTDLAGEWTTKDIREDGDSSNLVINIIYANGYWVAGGCFYGNKLYDNVAYTTDLAGEWTTKDIREDGDSSKLSPSDITYANGYWVVGGQYYDGSNSYACVEFISKSLPTISVSETYSYIKAKE